MDLAAAKNNKDGDQHAVAAKKKPTTLLDAYEVECIRRELERLVLKQNNQSAVGKGGRGATAVSDGHRHRHHGSSGSTTTTTTTTTTRARKKVKVASPSTAAAAAAKTKGARGGGVRLLGRHAIAICSGAVPVSAGGGGGVGGGGRRRVGGYREVEKV